MQDECRGRPSLRSFIKEVDINYSDFRIVSLRFKQPLDIIRLKSIAFCSCKSNSLEVHLRANFSLLPQGFDVRVLIPQE